jgi:hypothetical protein
MSITNLLSAPQTDVALPNVLDPAVEHSVSPSLPNAVSGVSPSPRIANDDSGDCDDSADADADGDDVSYGDDHAVKREFRCMNDEYSECRTGQYTLKLSRKVISNHFGRNKACTRAITDWPLFCRKHYQRATYKPQLWQRRKVHLILRQFNVIERLHPGTTYNVSLKKSEMDRLNLFARSCDAGMSPAQAGAMVAPDSSNKSFQAPIDVLRELQHSLGPNKSLKEVTEILAVINQMLRKNETEEVPSIEFLPELPGSAAAQRANTAAVPQRSGRISKKGAIQKPRGSK